ncbi:uncharacterized protein LOC112162354, partial [Oryzias melastigma]|uniref:uncharacterized protein LOC112162354 n=1 Tax=Oryzias melastigma TaxID=30732 RepID=UPI00168D4D63
MATKYSKYSDEEMISFLKPNQIKSYVHHVTWSVENSAVAVEFILEQFKGPAGLDIDGIPLFKDDAAVNSHWATASKHLSCMQDPPGIPLYISTKVVTLNGVELNRYKCRRGTNALEGLHAHLPRAVPSQRCGIMPFQVYLISFAVQWNSRMESLRVAGKERQPSCVDPRRIQLLNQQSELLFGREHLFKPDFTAPMPLPQSYTGPDEEELLGVEYALCQSTNFASREYYINQVEEEQSREEEEEQQDGSLDSKSAEDCDEGISLEDDASEDPIDSVHPKHTVLTSDEQVVEEVSPAQQDVLMGCRKLHLPGFKEVENLAMVLLLLVDDSDRHTIPAELRHRIQTAAGQLHEHDKSAVKFVKKYESKWGYTLFGRCLGPATSENIAAQKTKFARLTHAQAAQITEDSRLLYFLIKMLKNRPPASHTHTPTKISLVVKAQYKRIVDPILSVLNI